METLLRMHDVKHWFGSSDRAMKEAFHDMPLIWLVSVIVTPFALMSLCVTRRLLMDAAAARVRRQGSQADCQESRDCVSRSQACSNEPSECVVVDLFDPPGPQITF